ncbi:MAG: translation elongation factor-like protein [Dehalococcoidia bacterium]|jgi:putative protease|nr:translation elongation factor-like protein [Dehalococcoidia bacterium]|tara:strand:- start:21 stop:299 length:279 start_codon:yes stop_codon:yes gene_type:complete
MVETDVGPEAGTEVGRVDDYFARVGVAGIALTGDLSVGDSIQIKGHTTDLTMTVDSMQIDHDGVDQAGAGDSVGIKVAERCRAGDHVYRVSA